MSSNAGPAVSGSFFLWLLALGTVTAYSFNSQVFKWIGEADYGGKLFELFMFHCAASLFLLYFAAAGSAQNLIDEYCPGRGRLAVRVLIGAFFQMEIYYLWFIAAHYLPTQLLAAIFQSAISFVYLLSLIFLGEPFSGRKVAAVAVANVGIVTACFGHLLSGDDEAGASMPHGRTLYIGVALAIGAEISKASYQVWFKASFGNTCPQFALLFGSLIGLAHFFPVLPIIFVLDQLGVHDARMTVSDWTGSQVGLILLGAGIAAAVNIGILTVVSQSSPVFWSSVQMLAIPMSVVFDFLIGGILPNAYNCAGYVLIFGAFCVLTGLVFPKEDPALASWKSMSRPSADGRNSATASVEEGTELTFQPESMSPPSADGRNSATATASGE